MSAVGRSSATPCLAVSLCRRYGKKREAGLKVDHETGCPDQVTSARNVMSERRIEANC